MAKLRVNKKKMPGKTVNHEGGEAFKPSNVKHELVLSTLTCMYREPQFYESGDTIAQRIADLTSEVDTAFVINLAKYARNVMNLRSTPVFLLTLATAKRDYPVRDHVKSICVRADDLLEYMGGYIDIVGRPVPSGMKRGINDALRGFSEYHIAKYAGGNRNWTWKGLVKMTHPTEPDILIKKIMEKDGNKLETPYTWETELSEKGNKPEVWHALIDSKKLPYMACIRNLRNMLKVGVDEEHIKKVAEYISNRTAVKNSRQLPFRYLSAYRMLQTEGNRFHQTVLMDALSDAMDISAENVGVVSGKTEIVIDVSGSMETKISDKSTMTYKEAGAILGAITTKVTPESVIAVFADDVGVLARSSKRASVLEETERILRQNMGGSTMGYKVMEEAIYSKRFVDRFVVFTDCEMYNETQGMMMWGGMFGRSNNAGVSFRQKWLEYKQKVNPKAKLYIINMASNALMPVSSVDKDVVMLCGFSERVMDFIGMSEAGIDEQVKAIENYVPTFHIPEFKIEIKEDFKGADSAHDEADDNSPGGA